MHTQPTAEEREKIDAILHENATFFQNLGIDSTKAEKQEAKRKEWENLKLIRDIHRPTYELFRDARDK
jgi:hypothetical protein